MKILVTGTPGVGKTTASLALSKEENIEHIDITNYIKAHKIYESYDDKLDSYVFDEEVVMNHLNTFVKNKSSFIIDTHSPVVAADINFDFIFHIVCDRSILWKRQEERNYSNEKIMKNIESEIFNVIGEELDDYFDDQEKYLINGSEVPLEDVEYYIKDIKDIIKGKIIKF